MADDDLEVAAATPSAATYRIGGPTVTTRECHGRGSTTLRRARSASSASSQEAIGTWPHESEPPPGFLNRRRLGFLNGIHPASAHPPPSVSEGLHYGADPGQLSTDASAPKA